MSTFSFLEFEEEEETTTMSRRKQEKESLNLVRFVPEKKLYHAIASGSPWPEVFDFGEPFTDVIFVCEKGGDIGKIDYSESNKGILKVWFDSVTILRSVLLVK